MAMTNTIFASLLVCLFAIQLVVSHQELMTNPDIMESYLNEKHIDCGSLCSFRCSKSGRKKMCLRACGACCMRCNCVPPGTSGNKDVCPCYANMTTHGGKLKCP